MVVFIFDPGEQTDVSVLRLKAVGLSRGEATAHQKQVCWFKGQLWFISVEAMKLNKLSLWQR